MNGSHRRSLRRDAWWGIKHSLWYIAFFSVIATGLVLLTGGAVLAEYRLSLVAILGCYLLGGVVAGAVVGLLRPLTRTRSGAILVGTIAILPFVIGMGLLLVGALGPPVTAGWYPYYFAVASLLLSFVYSLGFVRQTIEPSRNGAPDNEHAPRSEDPRPVV